MIIMGRASKGQDETYEAGRTSRSRYGKKTASSSDARQTDGREEEMQTEKRKRRRKKPQTLEHGWPVWKSRRQWQVYFWRANRRAHCWAWAGRSD